MFAVMILFISTFRELNDIALCERAGMSKAYKVQLWFLV